MTNFVPFFLECSRQEVDQNRKIRTRKLSIWKHFGNNKLQQEGQHPLTRQRAANFRLLANH